MKLLLGLYSAKISTPSYFDDGSVVMDTYWSQPFLFKSDDDAVVGITKGVEGSDQIKLLAIYRVGKFDPFDGKISNIKERKEVFTYEKTVDETQPSEV